MMLRGLKAMVLRAAGKGGPALTISQCRRPTIRGRGQHVAWLTSFVVISKQSALEKWRQFMLEGNVIFPY